MISSFYSHIYFLASFQRSRHCASISHLFPILYYLLSPNVVQCSLRIRWSAATSTTPHSAVDAASRGAHTTSVSDSIQNLASHNDDTLPRWQEKYSSNSSRRKWIVSIPLSSPQPMVNLSSADLGFGRWGHRCYCNWRGCWR